MSMWCLCFVLYYSNLCLNRPSLAHSSSLTREQQFYRPCTQPDPCKLTKDRKKMVPNEYEDHHIRRFTLLKVCILTTNLSCNSGVLRPLQWPKLSPGAPSLSRSADHLGWSLIPVLVLGTCFSDRHAGGQNRSWSAHITLFASFQKLSCTATLAPYCMPNLAQTVDNSEPSPFLCLPQ